jgi:CheY-like chemotaxis protein
MRRKILIIDDEESIREVVKVTLEVFSGWTAVTASCASEGLSLAAAENPDAILLDLMMPDMDGFQTLKVLKANPATCAIPVVMLTAKTNTPGARELHPQGVKAIIVKPFNPLRLAGQISQALGW